MTVVRFVTCIDLRSFVPGEQRSEGLIEQRGIVEISSYPSGVFEKLPVNSCAHSYSYHAITMPQIWHNDKGPLTDQERLAARHTPASGLHPSAVPLERGTSDSSSVPLGSLAACRLSRSWATADRTPLMKELLLAVP